ncbi:hypothetical protein [Thetidibacter halocola]|uniref:Uncharacterized protein n=1 Tax=Thetidibacter halocola TaxID=2827239 RepID=A0A8J7W7W7_9RHOB|nr:hypothetical protein [Thetidibacter halocola]MBS0122542.1 hypothetical protein [Thetidibacter halocola]
MNQKFFGIIAAAAITAASVVPALAATGTVIGDSGLPNYPLSVRTSDGEVLACRNSVEGEPANTFYCIRRTAGAVAPGAGGGLLAGGGAAGVGIGIAALAAGIIAINSSSDTE